MVQSHVILISTVMYISESRSATPVTPDSVIGTHIINTEGSFSDSCIVQGKNDCGGDALTKAWTDQLLHSILRRETLSCYQISPDYLHSSILIHPNANDVGVSEVCRRRTCEWMYDICDHFHLNRDVVAIAMFYIDRFFTLTSFPDANSRNGNLRAESNSQQCEQVPVTRQNFHLVALTGLYIAIKTHGVLRHEGKTNQAHWSRTKFNVHVCASISRNQFSYKVIEECEQLMLRTLDWRVNPVVPSGVIIDTLVSYLPTTILDGSEGCSVRLFVYDCSKYLAELSVSVPALCMVYKPSVIAYASILYALDAYEAKYLLPTTSRSDFEILLQQTFDKEKDNITIARGILQVICPNLIELFSMPSVEPTSPTSVNMRDDI